MHMLRVVLWMILAALSVVNRTRGDDGGGGRGAIILYWQLWVLGRLTFVVLHVPGQVHSPER